jgi:iron complex outermembrane recepter protein
MNRMRRRLALGTSLPVLAMLAAAPVQAQATDPAVQDPAGVVAPGQATPEAAAEPVAEPADVVVTGSRIARRDFTAESPITTVTQEFLENSGPATLEQSLNALPQFQSSLGEQNTSAAIGGPTAGGGRSNANLRGLGPSRTLVLFDGRRLQPSDSLGAVDLNTISSALVSSIETITGGASAVYGSDAVAGVINLRFNNRFRGIEVQVDGGVTERGDGSSLEAALTMGDSFAGDRGRAFVSLSYLERNEASQNSREFFADRNGSLGFTSGTIVVDGTNPFGAATARPAAITAYRNLFLQRYGTPVPAAASSLAINPDGTLFGRTGASNLRDPIANQFVIDDQGVVTQRSRYDSTVRVPLTRYTVFGRLEYNFTDAVEGYAQANFATYRTDQLSSSGTFQTIVDPVLVRADNPFVLARPDLVTALNSRPNAAAPLQYYFTGTRAGRLRVIEDYDVTQVLLGLRGDLGGGLRYDVYGSYGRTAQEETTQNQFSRSRFNRLLNGVGANGLADGGREACAGGYDPFGYDDISDSCKAYLLRSSTNTFDYEQAIASASVTGNLFRLPGGNVGFAAGAEYRRNEFQAYIDPANRPPAPVVVAGRTVFPGPETLGVSGSDNGGGAIAVREGFAELLLPLLADVPAVQRLEVDLAYRYSDYDRVGGVHTYKAGANYSPFTGATFRGGYSRAIRAPGLGELFSPRAGVSGQVGSPTTGTGDPCDRRGRARAGQIGGVDPASVRALCIAQGVPAALYDTYQYTGTLTAAYRVGNPALNEEKADSYTVGLVLQPGFLRGAFRTFSFSVDYYDITLKDAIGLYTSQVALQQCFNFTGTNPTYSNSNFACAQINRDAAGLLSFINENRFNLGSYRTTGLDFQLDAVVDAGNAGSFSLNSVVNYTIDYKIQNLPGDPTLDYAGTIGNVQIDGFSASHPAWKHVTTLTWFGSRGSLSVRWRFIDKMGNAANVGVANGTATGVPAVSYFDLIGRVKANERIEFRLGVTNLTDKQPPQFGGPASFDAATYDILGRRYFIGATTRF